MIQHRPWPRTTSPAEGVGTTLPRLEELPGVADIAWAILARVGLERDPARIVFSSAGRRSGNSILAAATAIALLRHARVPVCLIEANVEHPALARYLGLNPEGLSDILDDRIGLRDCIQTPSGCPGLFVLPGGTARRPLSGEFASERMRSILERVGALGRYVVLDAPRLLDQLDSRVLLQRADCSVLVLRAGVTTLDDARRVQRIALESGTPLLGLIFNAYGSAAALGRVDPYQLTTAELALPTAVTLESDPFACFEPVSAPGAPGAATEATPAAGDAGDAHGLESASRNGNGASGAEPKPADGREHEIELLERRIAKLMESLAQTESELRRICAAKDIDPGIASVYRSVQGLAAEAGALACKQALMERLFQANLLLKQATRDRN